MTMEIVGLDQEMLEDDLRLAREVLGDLRADDPRRADIERYIAHLEAYRPAGRERVSAEMEAAIGRAVDRLSPAGAGWWHASTAETVAEALGTLTGHGMTLQEATDFVARLIGAIQSEYGD